MKREIIPIPIPSQEGLKLWHREFIHLWGGVFRYPFHHKKDWNNGLISNDDLQIRIPIPIPSQEGLKRLWYYKSSYKCIHSDTHSITRRIETGFHIPHILFVVAIPIPIPSQEGLKPKTGLPEKEIAQIFRYPFHHKKDWNFKYVKLKIMAEEIPIPIPSQEGLKLFAQVLQIF